jgi:hypothetical protein
MSRRATISEMERHLCAAFSPSPGHRRLCGLWWVWRNYRNAYLRGATPWEPEVEE